MAPPDTPRDTPGLGRGGCRGARTLPIKLTDTFIRGMAPNKEERDAVVEGLIARRRADALSFVFQFQRHGKRHKLTLGQYPGLSLAQARVLARAHRDALGAGRLPHAVGAPCKTVDDLLDRYAAHLSETAKSPAQVTALLDKHVRPRLGPYELTAITRRELQALVDGTRPASVAGAVGRYVKAAWRYGLSRDLVDRDIASLLAMPATGEPRQRVLTDEEVGKLIRDWWPLGPDAAPRSALCAVLGICLLTAARRSEIAEATFGEIQGDTLHLSAARSKGDRTTEVHLSSFVLRLLASVPKRDEHLVFPTERGRTNPGQGGDRPGRSGRGAVSGFSRAVADSQRRTKTAEWTTHDTRRTAATRMAEDGVPPHVIEAILNHAPPRLTRTYQVAPYGAERRAALEAWGARVWRLSGWD